MARSGGAPAPPMCTGRLKRCQSPSKKLWSDFMNDAGSTTRPSSVMCAGFRSASPKLAATSCEQIFSMACSEAFAVPSSSASKGSCPSELCPTSRNSKRLKNVSRRFDRK